MSGKKPQMNADKHRFVFICGSISFYLVIDQ